MKEPTMPPVTSPHIYDHLGQTKIQGRFPDRIGKTYTPKPHNKTRPGTGSFNGLLAQGKFS